MRSLINHLQAQCKLYSLETNRCKKQCKELEEELTKLKAKQETVTRNEIKVVTSEPPSINSATQQQSPSNKDEITNLFAPSTSQKEESMEGVRRIDFESVFIHSCCLE